MSLDIHPFQLTINILNDIPNLGPMTVIGYTKSSDGIIKPAVDESKNPMLIFNQGLHKSFDGNGLDMPIQCVTNTSGYDIHDLTLAIRLFDHDGEDATPTHENTFEYSSKRSLKYSQWSMGVPGTAQNVKIVSSFSVEKEIIDGYETYIIHLADILKNQDTIFFDIKFEYTTVNNSFSYEIAFFGELMIRPDYKCGDIDNDGDVDSTDLNVLGQYLANLRDSLPCQFR